MPITSKCCVLVSFLPSCGSRNCCCGLAVLLIYFAPRGISLLLTFPSRGSRHCGILVMLTICSVDILLLIFLRFLFCRLLISKTLPCGSCNLHPLVVLIFLLVPTCCCPRPPCANAPRVHSLGYSVLPDPLWLVTLRSLPLFKGLNSYSTVCLWCCAGPGSSWRLLVSFIACIMTSARLWFVALPSPL